MNRNYITYPDFYLYIIFLVVLFTDPLHWSRERRNLHFH